ncbi:MAG: permease prefix domain 1-containing protein [Spirochaetota bacterium]|jgi:hypothetical protein|nr:permease prefix domain 1-containing protein [Spirochaetota bacterium]
MKKNKLSDAAMRKIDELVERVAKKAGYSGAGEQGFKYAFAFDGFGKHYHKAGRASFPHKGKPHCHDWGRGRDFAEEIRAYLADGILDLMADGHSEEEALKMTLDKFGEAEIKEDFSALFDAFDGFGIQAQQIASWYVKNGEVLGLFYAAFALLGIVTGAFLGYLLSGCDWISAMIGAGFGSGFGVSFGLLSHALLRLFKR